MTDVNFCDRGCLIRDIKDGMSNTIAFMHSYSLCGSKNTGTLWLYTAGLQQPPESMPEMQPWARATYIGQSGMTGPHDRSFQTEPAPYDQTFDPLHATGCDPLLPATPHRNVMPVLLLDASVRNLSSKIGHVTWNKACLPNDGSAKPGTEWDD